MIPYNNFVSFINDPCISTDSNFSMVMMKRKCYNVLENVSHSLCSTLAVPFCSFFFSRSSSSCGHHTTIHSCLRVNEIFRPKTGWQKRRKKKPKMRKMGRKISISITKRTDIGIYRGVSLYYNRQHHTFELITLYIDPERNFGMNRINNNDGHILDEISLFPSHRNFIFKKKKRKRNTFSSHRHHIWNRLSFHILCIFVESILIHETL